MGNCLDRPLGGRGGADDAAHCATKPAVVVEDEEVPHKGSEKAAPVTEVKIRITKKQLEELLRRLEGEDGGGGGAAVAELLCKASSCNFRHRTGPEEQLAAGAAQWRPSLQSIPE